MPPNPQLVIHPRTKHEAFWLFNKITTFGRRYWLIKFEFPAASRSAAEIPLAGQRKIRIHLVSTSSASITSRCDILQVADCNLQVAACDREGSFQPLDHFLYGIETILCLFKRRETFKVRLNNFISKGNESKKM